MTIDDANGSDIRATEAIPRSRMFAALATASLALIGVLIVLVAFGRGTRTQQSRLADVIEPASAAMLDLQRVLALQMSAQRGYHLGGASESLRTYRRLLADEQHVYDRLAPLAHVIGPEATAALAGLRAAAGRWHEAVEREESADAAEEIGGRLSTREGHFAAALGEANRLGVLIQERAEEARSAIANRRRVEDALIVTMLLLATLSVAALARLGHRMHRVSLASARVARIAEARHRDLRRVTEEKEAFIRGITHDLKNPLGVIDGSAELLEIGARGALNDQQRATIARIRRAAAEMLGTIQDLLELSRAEAAALILDEEDTDLAGLVEETVETYRPALERGGLRVLLEPEAGQLRVVTDPAKVREILGNLLTNAARHASSAGAVTVTLARRKAADRKTALAAITVRDDGSGVPAGEEDRIFKEFARGPASEGSGLGLAIGRKLARALGGDLVRDPPPAGGGAAFTLLLPAPPGGRPHGRRHALSEVSS